MRTAAFTFILFVACGYAANCQRFTLLPQVGFENSKTSVNYNETGFFAPEGVKFTPQASLRLNYASKKGHGFFLGMATSRNLIAYSFSDPETGRTDYSATADDLQLQLEGGYQFSSKPIYLNKKSQAKSTKTTTTSQPQKTYTYTRCGQKIVTHCCSSKSTTYSKTSKDKTWVKIQPSVGMAYIPGTKTDFVTKAQNGQTVYEYRAGNWNTGVIAGVGFEFGKNKNRLFTVSANYFKGIGNLDQQEYKTATSTKETTTTLDSKVSGWNLRFGIPFTLGGGKPSAAKKKQESTKKTGCSSSYKIQYRCRSIQ